MMMYRDGDTGGWGYVLRVVSFGLFWGTITAIVLFACEMPAALLGQPLRKDRP